MRCKLFPARDTLFSSQPWIFIIKPILFRTSGNQRPTAHRCHCLNNIHHCLNTDGSGIFISIFLLMYLLNTALESGYIYITWALASLHTTEVSLALRFSKGCFQWLSHTVLRYGDLWSSSVASDHLQGFQCLTVVYWGTLLSWGQSRLSWAPFSSCSVLQATLRIKSNSSHS